jgi:lysophospholipase L1-like esterase
MSLKLFYILFIVAFVLVALLTVLFRRHGIFRALAVLSGTMLFIILLEAACMVAIHIRTGYWPYDIPYNQNIELFEPHPYMVGMPRKGARVTIGQHTYTNNSQGYRGPEMGAKQPGTVRVAVVGASTSYGVGVNDNQTWPHYLDSLLGPGFEVLNTGVPGHTTVEHIMFAATLLPDLQPDIVLLHAGLNDLRSLNMQGVRADYTDYHAPSFAGSLGFCPRNGLPHVATVQVLISALERLGWYPMCDFHRMAQPALKQGDTRALDLFTRNMHTLTAVCEQTGARLVFVPQVVVKEKIAGNQLWWWMPYVSDAELMAGIDSTNAIMHRVATARGHVYTDTIAPARFSAADFGDPSHLNAAGNLRFAQMLAGHVRGAMATEALVGAADTTDADRPVH